MIGRRRLDLTGVLGSVGLLGVAFLVVPMLVVIPMSFVADRSVEFPPRTWSWEPYQRLFLEAKWRNALLFSLGLAAAVSCITALLGLITAYGLFHSRTRLRPAIVLLLLAPLFVPPVVLGVGQLLTFARMGLVDSFLGLAMSHTLLALPYAILVMSAAVARSDMRLEHFACTMGASRVYAFTKVTLPQLLPGLLVSALLAFVVSFDEPVLALFLASVEARTLPRQMFDAIRYDLDPTAAAVASLLIIASFTGFLLRSWRTPEKE